MKKSFAVLPVLLGCVAFLSSSNLGAVKVASDYGLHDVTVKNLPGETIDYPPVGTRDEASPMMSIWQSGSFGFKRLDDRRVAVTGTAGWGQRCDYGATTFSGNRFEVSVDLTDYTRGDVLGLSLGPQGIYNGEGAQGLCMDIVKWSYDDEHANEYMITLNGGTNSGLAHNQSIEGWKNTDALWLDSYVGAVVAADDNCINIGWTIDGDNVKIHVNEYEKEFPVDAIFANLDYEKGFCVNFCSGYQAGPRTFIVNYVEDADDMAYYDQDSGTYYEVKKQVEDFVNAVKDVTLNTTQDFIDAYGLTKNVHLDDLYSYDQVYLRRTYDPALENLQNKAVEKFGNSVYVELLNYYVDELTTLVSDLSNEENLLNALSTIDMINNLNTEIDGLELTDEEKTEIEGIRAEFNTAIPTVQEAAGARYSNAVNDVIDKMNNAKTLEEVRAAEIAYNSISTTFRGYMDETALAALEANLATARNAFVEKYAAVSSDSGFVSGDDIRVVETEDTIGFTSWGSVATESEKGSGLLYTREALDVIDFNIDYSVDHFNQYAISIMANPTFFSAADNESIQNFKGFVFLVRSVNDTQASVQPFLIDGTCNRFFDGQLSQTDLIIQKSGDIHFSLAVNQVNTSGIVENYLEFSFNGAKYETPLVKEFDILGAFNDGKGYFGIGSQNGSSVDPLAITLKEVNGNKVTNSTLVNPDLSYAPVATETEYDFNLGDTNNLVIGIDPRLQTGLKFYMDGTQLTTGDHYTYQRNTTLSLKASYLNTLSEGEHTLKIESGKGSTEVIINIVKPSTGEDSSSTTEPDTSVPPVTSEGGGDTTPTSGLEPGAIAGIIIGAIAAVIIVGAVVIIIVKKKKNK
jgi:hypothetical protein